MTASASAAASASASSRRISHDDYQPMLDAVRHRFLVMRETYGSSLFTTDIDGRELWAAWLNSLPAEERQHHNCHACRRFIERYGGLVVISADGNTHSSVLGSAPGPYANAFDTVRSAVERARVTGVFVFSESVGELAKVPNWRGWHCVQLPLDAEPVMVQIDPYHSIGSRRTHVPTRRLRKAAPR